MKMYQSRRRNIQTYKAPLENQEQGTSLFTTLTELPYVRVPCNERGWEALWRNEV